MRLIDADKFKDAFNTDKAIGKTMHLMIDEQPTAYDVDKVVKKLEEESKKSVLVTLKAAFKVAVEIVKAEKKE